MRSATPKATAPLSWRGGSRAAARAISARATTALTPTSRPTSATSSPTLSCAARACLPTTSASAAMGRTTFPTFT
eukprot:6423683-Alexandrium_andersonii.AAC.1